MKSIKILKNVELTAIYTVDQQVVGLITYSLKMYVKALNDTVKFKTDLLNIDIIKRFF